MLNARSRFTAGDSVRTGSTTERRQQRPLGGTGGASPENRSDASTGPAPAAPASCPYFVSGRAPLSGNFIAAKAATTTASGRR